ncbi:MAG: hypothetical protein V4736_15365 [Bdellovibrionota bacterium]
METKVEGWKNCSSCKKPIAFGAKYFVCSVSTCNGLRTGYVFCSIPCFEVHLPGARHKDAGAIEKAAPSRLMVKPAVTTVAASVSSSSSSSVIKTPAGNIPREVLVIASRLKEYIHARSEYNTSASVMDALSDHLRVLCERAIDNARREGRKTVMDRDFEFLKGL